jgi:signal transduction histidine kinase
MRLKTKLVLTATGLTCAIVVALSAMFVGELLKQRVENTATNNEERAHEVALMTRAAFEAGMRGNPPADLSEDSLHDAVADALRSSDALAGEMDAIVRYSATVQDVSVTDAHGLTLVSTDPDAVDQPAPERESFARVRDGSLLYQVRQVFGRPRVLDISVPLNRNNQPFLVVHLGVRSTFLSNAYKPWMEAAGGFALLAALAAMLAAALLSTVALRPIAKISEQLEQLTLTRGTGPEEFSESILLEAPVGSKDAVVRVNQTIDRLGRQMRVREEGYTALQANLDQMLDTLRDGVVLFTADRRAAIVSDAVAHFVETLDGGPVSGLVGKQLEEIFTPDSPLGVVVLAAFRSGRRISAERVTLDDGRQVQISLDHIDGGRGAGQYDARGRSLSQGTAGNMGTLLTLRDMATALQLEQELEVSRRLAAIGRLTAGVGHEVKNPINAMVLHLELLRGKLGGDGGKPLGGNSPGGNSFDRESAQRHVEILAHEMQRLDRVVQTLADFSRPMELHLREHDLARVVAGVVDLTGAEMRENGVKVLLEKPQGPITVRLDEELIRQALLNLLLNAMQAMPGGGEIRLSVRRENHSAVVEIADDGEGIPAPLLPRIFDLYFTTKPKGSGIGLALTYRIVQLHGGAMDVRSNADPESPGRGTTFLLRLPIAAGTANGTRPATARLSSGAAIRMETKESA